METTKSLDFILRFDLRGPLVVAPLGGGPTTVDLVVATCEAGALGTLAAAYLSPAEIDRAAHEVQSRTKRAFAINLFAPVPNPVVSQDRLSAALEMTRSVREELGLVDPTLEPPYHHDFDAQFEAVLRARPRVFSFVFGLVERFCIDECRRLGIFTMGTATTLDEAFALRELGVDAVIAQGVEAGGHRGMFSSEAEDPGVHALDLTKILSTTVNLPIIAAGGMMTGQDIASALRAGASAAMLGTAFLLCPEAGTSKPYRWALKSKSIAATRLTRAFSGRLARGLANRFMKDFELDPSAILPFPAQNAFTRDIRNRATALNKPEYLSLWAGTGVSRLREMGAAKLVETLFRETLDAKNA